MVIDQVQSDLREAKIKAKVTGRPKHYYSIYQKMIVRGREFSDIYDLVGIRIVVESDRDCYAVLGVLHKRWNPVAGRFKDFVAMPKFNMYQSLHTTVIGPTRKPVEVQVRTPAMERRAEYGLAAHWRYIENLRSGRGKNSDPASDGGSDVTRVVRQLLNWQEETANPSDVLKALRSEINSDEVYVFTPRGDVLALPAGSSPVDFAYAIHTDVGHQLSGAQVNGRLVLLDLPLDNGDVVEVFTSDDVTSGPQRDWLRFVKSPRAKRHIRLWFRRLPDVAAAKLGEENLARIVSSEGLPRTLLTRVFLSSAAASLGFKRGDELTAAIGRGSVDEWVALRSLIAVASREPSAHEDEQIRGRRAPCRNTDLKRYRSARFDGQRLAIVRDLPGIPQRFARCCDPQPHHQIIAMVVAQGIASIHRTDCSRLIEHDGGRLLQAAWVGSDGGPSWARTVEYEVLVVSATPTTETDAQTTIDSALVSKVTVYERTANTLSQVLSLKLGSAETLRNMLEVLRRSPEVREVRTLARNYVTSSEDKRRMYRQRRQESGPVKPSVAQPH